MAIHMRTRIRDAAKQALTGLPTTGANVFSGRVSPLKSSEKPGLLVFCFVEDAGHGASNGGPTSERRPILKVEGVASGNDELMDTLDQMALEVEQALFADEDLRALLMNDGEPEPPQTIIEISDVDAGAAVRTGSVHLMFPVTYRTRLGDPAIQV